MLFDYDWSGNHNSGNEEGSNDRATKVISLPDSDSSDDDAETSDDEEDDGSNSDKDDPESE